MVMSQRRARHAIPQGRGMETNDANGRRTARPTNARTTANINTNANADTYMTAIASAYTHSKARTSERARECVHERHERSRAHSRTALTTSPHGAPTQLSKRETRLTRSRHPTPSHTHPIRKKGRSVHCASTRFNALQRVATIPMHWLANQCRGVVATPGITINRVVRDFHADQRTRQSWQCVALRFTSPQ